MSKSKKPKVSLVTAYESGAESDSVSESEQSNSSKSSRSSSASRSTNRTKSRSKSPLEDESFDGHKKKQGGNKEGDESDLVKSMPVDSEQSNDQIRKKNIDNLVSINVEISSKNEHDIKEKIDIEKDPNFFTEKNGFLPGSEKIKLPPAPEAQCSQSLQNKVIQVQKRMQVDSSYSINDDIKNKKKFKNPSIYEKLIEAYGIDEFGSSFENHIDDLKAHGFMFYDELDQAQIAEWAKKDKERKERTKIEMVSGIKRK